jgi:hypothetical protein
LMTLVLLVPLFRLININKLISFVFLFTFLGLWMFDVPYDNVLSIIPGTTPVLFFFAGSMLATQNKTPFLLDKFGIPLITIFIICITVGIIYDDKSFGIYISKAGILAGLFAALYSTGFFIRVDKVKKQLSCFASTSFFVFAFHEPVLEILQRLVLGIWNPGNDLERLLFYFILPILVIIIAVIGYTILNRFFPKLTAIITGGRQYHLSAKSQPS